MQSFVEDKRVAIRLQQVKCCLLADGNIALTRANLIKLRSESLCLTATPQTDGQGNCPPNVHYVE